MSKPAPKQVARSGPRLQTLGGWDGQEVDYATWLRKPGNSEGTISAGGAEEADRERNRSVGACLLQVAQERDSVIEQAIEDCVDKPNVLTSQNGYLLFLGDVCRRVEIEPRQPRDCSGKL
jgi:hypothetical protein